MQSDGLWLDVEDAAKLQSALEALETLAARSGYALGREVAVMKQGVAAFLGRVAGRADATTRPPVTQIRDADGELIDVEEAARMLGLTADALRKACRTGRYASVARKVRGRWMIPAADVSAEGAA